MGSATRKMMLIPIVDKGEELIDRKGWKEERARFTSTPSLFMLYWEEKDNVGTASRCTALDLFSGCL